MSKHYVLFILATFVAAFGQIALKRGTQKKETSLLHQYANSHVTIGYLMLFSSMAMASVSYQTIPLKIGPALDSVGFIIVPMLSHFFFGEKITIRKVLGFIIIMFGVIVFSF